MIKFFTKATEQVPEAKIVFSGERPFRILQMTDMQIIDLGCTRNPTRDRQIKNAYFKEGIPDMDIRCFQYAYELVVRLQPDLIILSGDNVYGEFDDNGEMQKMLILRMEELGVLWAPIFGNHDNESRKGVRWQMEQFEKAEHCLFSRGTCTGNGNFAIRLCRENGFLQEDIMTVYMLDSNGCRTVGNPHAPEEGITPDNVDYDLVCHDMGIFPDQIAWYRSTAERLQGHRPEPVPAIAFFHIPIHMFDTAFREKYHYQFGHDFTADHPGDSGMICEHNAHHTDPDDVFYHMARKAGTIGFFTGHEHKNDAVVHHDGAVFVYGVKTGTATYYRDDAIGGTLIQVGMDGHIEVTQQYCQKRMNLQII